MKRFIAAGLFLWLFSVLGFGQEIGDRQLWQKLGLTDQEINRILEIFDRTETTIKQARLEIDVLKAELKKALFQDKVDMREVERLLRAGLDWEYKLRLAQITRQVEMRQLLGDRKYSRLTEALKRRRQNAKERDDS